jgi:hypothetical protein
LGGGLGDCDFFHNLSIPCVLRADELVNRYDEFLSLASILILNSLSRSVKTKLHHDAVRLLQRSRPRIAQALLR